MAKKEEVDLVEDEFSDNRNATPGGRQANGPTQSNINSKCIARPRKRRSPYWDHYCSIDDPEDPHGYTCKYCDRLVHSTPRNGTRVLRNHLDRCKKYLPNMDKKQKLADLEYKTTVCEDGNAETTSEPELWSFDQEAIRKALAKMLIIDELPFKFVEGEGFRHFCEVICPQFVIPSWISMARDCYGIFIEERKKLKGCFSNLTSRVCLTIDTWTSEQDLSYLCLTAHFIDDDWKLHKKIINFCPIASLSGEYIGRVVEKCLVEWGLKNILTITVDNASSNDVTVLYLGKKINQWGGSVMDNKFLHMRCAAHILNLVVKDGLKELDASIIKVRNFVKFVKSSPARLQWFKACVEEEKIEGKGLVYLDVETRWNTTYLMLDTAVKFRKAFDSLYCKSGVCKKELRKSGGAPEQADWDKVSSFLPFLKIFYNATLRLSGSCYVPGNNHVLEINEVGYVISNYCQSNDKTIQDMARHIKMNYDKYWGNVENLNTLPFVALILDPRHKWAFVEWIIKGDYEESSAESLICKINGTLKTLFDFYTSSRPQSSSKQQESSSFSSYPHGNTLRNNSERVLDGPHSRRHLKFMEYMNTLEESSRKSELDKYLAENCESDDHGFDILQWWKDQSTRYPVLAAIARDVLAVPVSTVASESSFSTRGRVLDEFKTSVSPRMTEALVCTRSWLRTSTSPIMIDDIFNELEDMEEGMKELTLEQPIIKIDESLSISSDNDEI